MRTFPCMHVCMYVCMGSVMGVIHTVMHTHILILYNNAITIHTFVLTCKHSYILTYIHTYIHLLESSRKQDDQLLKEINTLISSKKSSDEMSIINFDINNAKKMLKEWSSFSAPVTHTYIHTYIHFIDTHILTLHTFILRVCSSSSWWRSRRPSTMDTSKRAFLYVCMYVCMFVCSLLMRFRLLQTPEA